MLVTLILPNGYQFCKTIWLEFLSYDHRWFLTGFWFPELPDPVKFPDNKFPPILLQIQHIIEFNMGNSKIKFATNFAKNHDLVFPNTTIFWCQVQNTVNVSNLWVLFLLSQYSSFKSDDTGILITSKLLTSTKMWTWHQKMAVFWKTKSWFMTKWFVNLIFEFPMLSWIVCSIFSKIGESLQFYIPGKFFRLLANSWWTSIF